MFMYPDYWFEIDADSNLLKLNGYIMENALTVREEFGKAISLAGCYGDMSRYGVPYVVNGAIMLNSCNNVNVFRAELDGMGMYGGMEYLHDEKTGIGVFERPEH